MKERARSIRGRLLIRSSLDRGTEIQLRVPGPVAYDGFGTKGIGIGLESAEFEENHDAPD